MMAHRWSWYLDLWWKGYHRYELRGRVIHRWIAPFRREVLPLDEVAGWTIYPEMIFDVVKIRRWDGGSLIWFDYDDDLNAILSELAESRRDKRSDRMNDPA